MSRVSFTVRLATQGMVGFGPAPGTMGTIMMIPMVYFLGSCALSHTLHLFILTLIFLFGALVVHYALPVFDTADPAPIVMDEMVAFLWVFVGIPMAWWTLLIGFILFRLFDIYKPFGISYIETLPGVFGVIGDDLVAALFSNLLLVVCVYCVSIL